jgi:hypothetical protein
MMAVVKGLIATLAGAILPLFALYMALTWRWDLVAQPAWAWLTITIMPLAYGALLLVPASWRFRLARPACAILLLHATILLVLLGLGRWPRIAGLSLFLDLLLVAAVPFFSAQERAAFRPRRSAGSRSRLAFSFHSRLPTRPWWSGVPRQ